MKLLLAVFFAYLLTARYGLQLVTVGRFAALVWAPTGIALTAVVLLGPRVVPAIFAAAFLTNYWTGAPAPSALGIAVGNSLEALVAFALLRRAGFSSKLGRLRDVVALFLGGAFVSPLISATIGVLSLRLGGAIEAGHAIPAWRAWWLGDALGDVLVAPLLFVLADGLANRRSRPFRPVRVAEAAALGACALAFDLAVFGGLTDFSRHRTPTGFSLFPIMIWAGLRFGPPGVAVVNFFLAALAIWGTSRGFGPFASPDLADSLFMLQPFLAVVSSAGLMLAATVEEKNAAEKTLEGALFQAQQAVLSRDDFISIASHELKTPITGVLLQLQLLQRCAGGPRELGPERTALLLSSAEKQSRKLANLIDQLLDLTRISSGRLELIPESVDLVEVAREVIERLAAEAKSVGSDITLKADKGIQGRWDRARAEQVISNLLSNAIKYGAGQAIEVVVDRVEGDARLRVRDHGIGIAPEMQARIFDRFERVSSGSNIAGLGLGLYIVRQIVEASGGTVGVESVPGTGATFTVSLPTAGQS